MPHLGTMAMCVFGKGAAISTAQDVGGLGYHGLMRRGRRRDGVVGRRSGGWFSALRGWRVRVTVDGPCYHAMRWSNLNAGWCAGSAVDSCSVPAASPSGRPRRVRPLSPLI